MNNEEIAEVEKRLASIEETISKMKELVADAKVCSSDITRSFIKSALKKYANSVDIVKIVE